MIELRLSNLRPPKRFLTLATIPVHPLFTGLSRQHHRTHDIRLRRQELRHDKTIRPYPRVQFGLELLEESSRPERADDSARRPSCACVVAGEKEIATRNRVFFLEHRFVCLADESVNNSDINNNA